MTDEDDISPTLVAIWKEFHRPEFVARHGSGSVDLDVIANEVLDWPVGAQPTTQKLNELREPIQRWLRESPRRLALYELAQRVQGGIIEREMSKGIAPDVEDLSDVIYLCAMALLMTEENVLDAFSDVFFRASQRIQAKELADKRHAPTKVWFEDAWTSYFHGNPNQESVRAFLNRFVRHHGGRRGLPSLRAFQSHFTERAKAEGISLRRGRRPKSAKS